MRWLIDANVILRYLIADNKTQADRAELTIREGAYTVPEVIAEVVYVLNGVYNLERKEICHVLSDLLEEINMAERIIVLEALKLYSNKHIDFVDAMLVARAHLLNEHVFTFDKKMRDLLY